MKSQKMDLAAAIEFFAVNTQPKPLSGEVSLFRVSREDGSFAAMLVSDGGSYLLHPSDFERHRGVKVDWSKVPEYRSDPLDTPPSPGSTSSS